MQASQPGDFSWMIPVEVMLGALDHGEVHSCSISRVPNMLRDQNDAAYKPNTVSIGPWHRATTRQLLKMEEAKLRYMRDFLERKGRSEFSLRDCAVDIIKLDKAIRACYAGGDLIEFDSHELSKIMIVDGCFLLELLLRLDDYINSIPSQNQNRINNNNPYLGDPLLQTEDRVFSVLNNITMLENQIPFIVLKKLYRNVFSDDIEIKHDHRVANIVHRVFGYPPVTAISGGGAAHILHLMHLSTVHEHDQQEKKQGIRDFQQLRQCATRLHAAGITIKPVNSNNITATITAGTSISISSSSSGDVVGNGQFKFVDVFNFDIRFDEGNGVLEIPTLRIKETTEVRWRNLIAWEQSRIWIKRMYTSYALFFQGLICCKHDIEMLMEKGVIVIECKNKSKEELLVLFRTISKGAEHMDPSYTQICERLNEYKAGEVRKVLCGLSRIAWHKWWWGFEFIVYCVRYWYNILITDHIPNVWKFLGVLAAIVLLVLTIMQTYYSSRSVA